MSFHVGQRVVCVDDCGLALDHIRASDWERIHVVGPKRNNTYTVRGFCEYTGGVGLLLEEIVNEICVSLTDGIGEPAWRQHRFRPITERKTDISIFTKLLTPSKRERETV